MHLGLGLGRRRGAQHPVSRMISALRRLGGNLWMVDNAYTGAFVDNVGTTPVTAYAGLLGLTTDRLGVLGVNLVTTPSVTGAAVDSVTAVLPYPVGFGMTVGKTYRCTYTVSGFSGSLDVGFASGSFSAVTGATRVSANGTYSFTATAVNQDINVFTRPISNTANFSNVAVRELTGNHATQSAVASKPSVQRVPKRTRGATNLLLRSGDFSNAAWTKAGATVATGQADPFGGTAASKLVESATNSAHYFLQSVVSGTGTATSAWVVKPAGRTKIQIRSESPQTGMLATMFNLATGAIQNGTGSIVALDNGFFLCVATAPSNGTGANGYHLMQTLSDSWQETYTGDGTSGVIVYLAALFTGTITAQQIIDNGGIPITTTQPLPNVLEWANVISFDGSNDFLQTGITTGNEGWVCAGVTFGAPIANDETVFSNGAGSATLKGVWFVRLANGPASDSVRFSVGNGTALTHALAPSGMTVLGVPRVIEGGWTASTVMVGVDGQTNSVARTGDATPAPNPPLIGAYLSGFHHLQGPMHAIAYAPVLPDAATRKIIRNGIAALQGRTL